MLSVLVANSKGGCGKTTIATNLAGAYAQGGFKTAIADVDKQKSSLGWLKRRDADLPEIQGLDWTKKIDPAGKKVQRLVIDAPAAVTLKQFEDLLRMADVIVLPVLPSAFDQAATKRFLKKIDDLKPIRKSKKPVCAVGNKIRLRTRAASALEAFLTETGHPVVAHLKDRILYADAALSGASIYDLGDRTAKAAQEDWTPLLTYIEAS